MIQTLRDYTCRHVLLDFKTIQFNDRNLVT